jgi:hypothetical protein
MHHVVCYLGKVGCATYVFLGRCCVPERCDRKPTTKSYICTSMPLDARRSTCHALPTKRAVGGQIAHTAAASPHCEIPPDQETLRSLDRASGVMPHAAFSQEHQCACPENEFASYRIIDGHSNAICTPCCQCSTENPSPWHHPERLQARYPNAASYGMSSTWRRRRSERVRSPASAVAKDAVTERVHLRAVSAVAAVS